MKFFAALALSALLPLPALASDDTTSAVWYADFDEAAKVAQEQGKDLFVDFTGSDWCGWCIKLHEEVFQYDAFLEAAQKDYILVALDYPRSDEAKAKVPNPERNAELAKQYGVRGYPTVLMMTADGYVFGQTGYQEGGPESYVEHMAELRTEGRPVLVETKKVVEAFDAASAEAKPAAWEAALKRMEELPEGSPLVSMLAVPVRWAFEADADNAKGMKLRAAKALLKRGQVDEELMNVGRELDPKNEHGLLELVVQGEFMGVQDDDMARAAQKSLDALALLGFQDKEVGFQLNFTMAIWCDRHLDDPEGLQRYGAAAKALGTEDKEALDYLEQMLQG